MNSEKMETVVFDEPQETDNNVPDNNATYKYTMIDCLDEDAPIPGQRFALLSFISPARLMNCNITGLKVRGVYEDYAKAQKAADKLNKVDKIVRYFHSRSW